MTQSSGTESRWGKDFHQLAQKWVKSQNGVCACMGNCKDCGYHVCHGCLCSFMTFIREVESQAERRGRGQILNLMQNIQQDIEKSDYPRDYKSGAFNLAVKVNVELDRIEAVSEPLSIAGDNGEIR